MESKKISVKTLENRLARARSYATQIRYVKLLAQETRFSDPARSNQLIRNGLEMAKVNQDKTSEMEFLNSLAINHSITGNDSEALSIFFDCLNYWKRRKNELKIAGTYNNVGIILKRTGKYEEALKYISRSHRLKVKLRMKKEALNNLQDIGVTLSFMGRIKEAKKIYKRVLQQATKSGWFLARSNALNDLGDLAFRDQDYALALDYFVQSYSALNSSEFSHQYMRSMHNAGVCYFKLNNFVNARACLYEALKLCRDKGFTIDESNTMSELCKVEAGAGNWKEACLLFLQHREVRHQMVNIQSQQKMSNVQLKLRSTRIQQELEIEGLKTRELQNAREKLLHSQQELLTHLRSADVGDLTARIAEKIEVPLETMRLNLAGAKLPDHPDELRTHLQTNMRINDNGITVNNMVKQLLKTTSSTFAPQKAKTDKSEIETLVNHWFQKKTSH